MTTTTTILRQLRILEIIIICYLAKSMEGKSSKEQLNEDKNERAKRGYSHYGGNDFGSSTHVSSAVLQFGGGGEEHVATLDSSSHLDASVISAAHSGSFDTSSHLGESSISLAHSGSLDTLSHLDSSASSVNSWSPSSGHSLGEEVWLEPLPDYHGSSAIDSSAIHSSSIASTHPGSDLIANTVFSDDSPHTAQFELPSSQLHTQISSSSIGSIDIGGSIHDHGAAAISDNIDFHNVADVESKHYAKSYVK